MGVSFDNSFGNIWDSLCTLGYVTSVPAIFVVRTHVTNTC
jgi:hypothetical protein